MKITIDDSRKISDIQGDFNLIFPYLKIEFFSRFQKIGGSSARKFMKNATNTLGECRIIHKKGNLIITPKMTVAELEQNFANIYGLSVQVFRKSSKVWLETTITDRWSLEEQNKQGEELSSRNSAA
jgi:hypothetical protein